YAGGAFAVQAMLANEAQAYASPSLFGMEEHLKSGRLKVLGVMSDKRFPLYPDVPTVGAETGQDVLDATYTLTQVRAGTPQPIIDKLAATTSDISADPAVQAKVRKLGFEPRTLPNDETNKIMNGEFNRARDIAKMAGLAPPQ